MSSQKNPLTNLHKPATLTDLIAALKDKKELVRADAALALGEMKAKEAVPYLENALRIENRKRARLDMYFALFRMGRETDLAPLLHMLKAKPPGTRAAAADRLVRLVNDDNCNEIKGALEYSLVREEDEEVKEILKKGIAQIVD